MNEILDNIQNSEREKRNAFETVYVQYLSFWVDSQLYGFPISEVVSIIGVHKIIAMPEYPDYAKGIINLRGSIIPVIDIRIRFHKAEKEYNERTCIIVANISGKHVGFIVDAVDEVTSIKVDDIAQTPDMASEGSNRYVTGIGKMEKNVVLLLDANKIIKADEMNLLYTSNDAEGESKIA